MELQVTTSDLEFLSALQAANLPGVSAQERAMRIDCIDSPIPEIMNIIINFATAAAANLFAAWIIKRMSKEKSNKTTINNINVTNNHKQVTIIINEELNKRQKNSVEQ